MTWSVQDAETVRQMIKHENEVIHHRLTWLVTLQGFLFAALGFAWKDGKQIVSILAGLGISTSISLLLPLYCADTAIRRLITDWDKNKPPNYTGPDVTGYRPFKLVARGFFPWFLLPSVLVVAWIVILAVAWIVGRRLAPRL